MKSVTDENSPILQAAKKYDVPKSTLHDRISGKVHHGDKPGPKPLLSAVEESEFANFGGGSTGQVWEDQIRSTVYCR